MHFEAYSLNERSKKIPKDKKKQIFKGFYPRDAMLAQVIAIATCPSVCLSVHHAPVLCQNEES